MSYCFVQVLSREECSDPGMRAGGGGVEADENPEARTRVGCRRGRKGRGDRHHDGFRAVETLLVRGLQGRGPKSSWSHGRLWAGEQGKRQNIPSQEEGSVTPSVNRTQEMRDEFIAEVVVRVKTLS